jgi:hypothetical protein
MTTRPTPTLWKWDWRPYLLADLPDDAPPALRQLMSMPGVDLFVAYGRGDQGSDAFAVYPAFVPKDDEYMPPFILEWLQTEGLAKIQVLGEQGYRYVSPPEGKGVDRVNDPALRPTFGRSN